MILAGALLVFTKWRYNYDLNLMSFVARMLEPVWVFDAMALTDPEEERAAAFTLWCTGDGEVRRR